MLLTLLVVCWLCCANIPSLDLSKLVVEEGAAEGGIVYESKSSNILFNKGLDDKSANDGAVVASRDSLS